MSTWRPSVPPPSEREPKKLSESLDRLARRLGGPAAEVTSTVFSRWGQLVGDDIAAHARPVSLRAGVLTLAVDQPAWATQLRYMTVELLGRIRDATGSDEVLEIHLRVVGPGGADTGSGRGTRRPS